MKYVSYRAAGADRFGIACQDGVIELGPRTGAASLRQLLLSGGLGRASEHAGAKPDHAWSEIEHLPVIPDPAKIICIGVNYADHAAEMNREPPPFPTVFVRFADSQVGHERPIKAPRHSTKLDYEGELAVIIGKPGRDIAPGDAYGHVAGYSCYNDVSIRDYQNRTSQFTPGKNFTGCGAFGPCLVTADEMGPIGAQRITTRVNGETRQDSQLKYLIFDVPALIASVSEWTQLSPGDVIITGTPAGVAAGMKLPRWMKPGDVVEVEIDGLGVLRNTITE